MDYCKHLGEKILLAYENILYYISLKSWLTQPSLHFLKITILPETPLP